MEKKLTLGFFGTKAQADMVRSAATDHGLDIQLSISESEGYLYGGEAAEAITRLKSRVSGILFGDELQMTLCETVVGDDLPYLCLKADSASLLAAMLKLSSRGLDVSRVSVDTFSVRIVSHAMADAGIRNPNFRIVRRRTPADGERYCMRQMEEHRDLYQSGTVRACITTLPLIRDLLEAENVPAVYASPTSASIARGLEQLQAECLYRLQARESGIVFLALLLRPPADLIYQPRQTFFRSQENWKALSEIHRFAEQTGAAVIPLTERYITIVVTRDRLNWYSGNLESLPFLQMIQDTTRCEVALGIGFGRTPQEARTHGELALKASVQQQGNAVYLARSPDLLTGPLQFVRVHPELEIQNWDQYQPLVEKTGISAERLFRIHLVLKRTGRHLFTAAELSSQLGISIRAANRLLITLEETGYATLSGRAVTGKSGRPGNVYSIHLDLS